MASFLLLAFSACGYTIVPVRQRLGTQATVGRPASGSGWTGAAHRGDRRGDGQPRVPAVSAACAVPVAAACFVAAGASRRAIRPRRATPPVLMVPIEPQRGPRRWIDGMVNTLSPPQKEGTLGQANIWLNGEKVVVDPLPAVPPTLLPRRPVLAAGLVLPWLAAQLLVGAKRGGQEASDEEEDSYYAGDAVTRPGIESKLLETLESLESVPPELRDPVVAGLVTELEERGGSQLESSSGFGRWVLPWVGGWQRLWTNSADASFLGGPAADKFGFYKEISHRQFVYGPGDGGAVEEYLFECPGGEKYLLSRAAGVTNLGDRYFQLDFPQPLQAYGVISSGESQASKGCFEADAGDPNCSYSGLKSTKPVEVSGAPTAPAALGLVLRTTYLSELFWVVRSKNGDKVAVFQRTPAQSVMDRRGLVMEGELNPSKSETVRYGSLLFGDSEDSYSGWGERKAVEAAGQDKLLGR